MQKKKVNIVYSGMEKKLESESNNRKITQGTEDILIRHKHNPYKVIIIQP
jgi:hypothetical protein